MNQITDNNKKNNKILNNPQIKLIHVIAQNNKNPNINNNISTNR